MDRAWTRMMARRVISNSGSFVAFLRSRGGNRSHHALIHAYAHPAYRVYPKLTRARLKRCYGEEKGKTRKRRSAFGPSSLRVFSLIVHSRALIESADLIKIVPRITNDTANRIRCGSRASSLVLALQPRPTHVRRRNTHRGPADW